MTAQDIIDALSKVHPDAEVKILGEYDGETTREGSQAAISINDSGQVIEYEDYVAITRLI